MSENNILVFQVGSEEYGVQIEQVVSIERMQNITPYPNQPPHVLGVTTVRELVTPVVDVRAALTGKAFVAGESARIIIVIVSGKEVGLVVDAATDVMDIDPAKVQHPNLLKTNNASYLLGMANLDQRLIILLDIEKLLQDTTNLDELREIKEAL